MLFIETITREVLHFMGPLGKCVRYKRNYQSLHPETEFKAFVRDQLLIVGSVYMAGALPPYDHDKTKALPFVIDWEEPECMYL